MGICKLCGKNAKRISKSHIIPDFMHNKLLDENHRMLLTGNSLQGKPKVYQTGFYEKYILCDKCDNVLLGTLEKYGSIVLNDANNEGVHTYDRKIVSDGTQLISISNTKYVTFKLFVLSILWKTHVSTNIFYKNINIHKHEQVIRQMLLNGDAGREDHYQISILGLRASNV